MTARNAEVGRCERFFAPRPRRYVPRITFSINRGHGEGTVNDGQYLIIRDSHILMSGRTFSRDDAEAICAALEDAADAGAEEAWEG